MEKAQNIKAKYENNNIGTPGFNVVSDIKVPKEEVIAALKESFNNIAAWQKTAKKEAQIAINYLSV